MVLVGCLRWQPYLVHIYFRSLANVSLLYIQGLRVGSVMVSKVFDPELKKLAANVRFA